MKTIRHSFLLFVLLAIASCGSSETKNAEGPSIPKNATLIADTITYDVMLRAIDEENIWEVEQLKHLNREAFVLYVFDGIYSNRFKAFDFYNGKPLTIDDVKKIETTEGYARGKVSKVQFKEMWFVDSLGNFRKQIHSFTLGIEAYSSQNTFMGHKALFTVRIP